MLTGMAKLQRFDLRPDDPGSNPARMTGWIFEIEKGARLCLMTNTRPKI
jgi:hypothetical protein